MTSFFARITDKSRNVVINVNLTHSDYISTEFFAHSGPDWNQPHRQGSLEETVECTMIY